uniref:Aquaporin 10a n=1 Tax=Oncorhynchus kisutch TaxID=8019 RepID=A0A8C7FKA0_ONCKI
SGRRNIENLSNMFGYSASALSANMAFSVGVMSAMYLCKGVSGLMGRVPWVKLLPYALCLVLGAYLASGLVFLVYYDAIMYFSGGNLTVYGANETASIFATYPSEHLSLRVVATAMLMLCILPLDDQKNSPAPDALIPPIVAVVVLGIGMSMSSNCGGAINPARDLGPRLLTLTAGWVHGREESGLCVCECVGAKCATHRRLLRGGWLILMAGME